MSDWDDETPATESTLDRWADLVKMNERWGLAFGVAVQLAVLLSMIVMGTMKVLGEFF